jgi:hypothetical protein
MQFDNRHALNGVSSCDLITPTFNLRQGSRDMTRLRWVALAAVLAAAACGGGNTATTPTVPTPVYNGSWGGNYTITSCTQDGQFAAVGVCGLFTNGQVLPFSFLLSQTDRNVSGTGTGTAPGFGEVVNVTPTWSLHLSGTLMSGTLVQLWSATGLTGQGTINGTMSSSTKFAVVASQTAPATLVPRSIGEMRSAIATAP